MEGHIIHPFPFLFLQPHASSPFSVCPPRPGKSCKLSSSGKFRDLQCPQSSVAWWNPQIVIAHSLSTGLHPQFWILNPLFSIILPQISLIHPQFTILNSSFSILSQKYGIFDWKCPQQNVRKHRLHRLQLFHGLLLPLPCMSPMRKKDNSVKK